MKIERLTASEFDALAVGSFLMQFAKEHRFGALQTTAINEDRAWAHIWQMLEEGAVWVARDAAGGIVGSISVSSDTLWWTDRPYLSDGWFYVGKDKRGSTAALLLLDQASMFAKARSLPLVIKVFHAGKPEIVGKFLTRIGFSMLGGTYIKEF